MENETFKLIEVMPEPSFVVLRGKKYPLDVVRLFDEAYFEEKYGSFSKMLVLLSEKPFTVLQDISYRIMRHEISEGVFESDIAKDYDTFDKFTAALTRHDFNQSGIYDKVMAALGISLIKELKGEQPAIAGSFPELHAKDQHDKKHSFIASILRLFRFADRAHDAAAISSKII
jgi:hypothetical protein